LRAAALNALSAVAVSLDRRTLTQDRIDMARQAVAAVLAARRRHHLRSALRLAAPSRRFVLKEA